jgi:hypothetical protein
LKSITESQAFGRVIAIVVFGTCGLLGFCCSFCGFLEKIVQTSLSQSRRCCEKGGVGMFKYSPTLTTGDPARLCGSTAVEGVCRCGLRRVGKLLRNIYRFHAHNSTHHVQTPFPHASLAVIARLGRGLGVIGTSLPTRSALSAPRHGMVWFVANMGVL